MHRDIKPSNILVDPNDFAYLIDFGIARASDDTRLTSENSAIGTWAYMAPERFSTSEIHPSSDIYALACVLYQCLTGEQPFPGTTLEQVAVGHIGSPPPRPSEHAAIPAAMDQVIATGLAKKPAETATPPPSKWQRPQRKPSPCRPGNWTSRTPTQATHPNPANHGAPIYAYPQTPPGSYGMPPAPPHFSTPHLQRPPAPPAPKIRW